MAGALEKYLGRSRLEMVRSIADRAFALGYSSYLAGGFVRDLLLELPHGDIDIVVEGDAIRLAKAMAKEQGDKVTAHAAFGTATWHRAGTKVDPRSVDLAMARTEIYSAPAALPTVRPASIEADLRRRDFSVNALALSLDIDRWGQLLDPVGGKQDLHARSLRVLHAASFIDDPTRMYRAIRYEQRLGLKISADTLDLIPGARGYVGALTPQRIRHELDLILDESSCSTTLGRLQDLDLLSCVHPRLSYGREVAERLAKAPAEDPVDVADYSPRALRWILWLLDLSAEEVEELATRLAFDSGLKEVLRVATTLRRYAGQTGDLKPSEYVKRLRGAPDLAVWALSLSEAGSETGRAFAEYLSRWRHVSPTTTGDDLRAAGLRPGPAYARILERLRAARLDGEVSSTEAEQQLLERLVREEGAAGPRAGAKSGGG